MQNVNDLPDNLGRFGEYGGRFVPETLMPAVYELESAYRGVMADEEFHSELNLSLIHI